MKKLILFLGINAIVIGGASAQHKSINTGRYAFQM